MVFIIKVQTRQKQYPTTKKGEFQKENKKNEEKIVCSLVVVDKLITKAWIFIETIILMWIKDEKNRFCVELGVVWNVKCSIVQKFYMLLATCMCDEKKRIWNEYTYTTECDSWNSASM